MNKPVYYILIYILGVAWILNKIHKNFFERNFEKRYNSSVTFYAYYLASSFTPEQRRIPPLVFVMRRGWSDTSFQMLLGPDYSSKFEVVSVSFLKLTEITETTSNSKVKILSERPFKRGITRTPLAEVNVTPIFCNEKRISF